MNPTPSVCSIVIVDDSTGFRRAAQRHIESLRGMAIAGCAADGAEGLASVARLKPDVVLVDINMPGLNGFEVARRIKRMADAPGVVLVSLHVDAGTHREARMIGGVAVLAKSEFVAELPGAIDKALANRAAGEADPST